MNGNLLASGDLNNGISQSYPISADNAYKNGIFLDMAIQGEYLYVTGTVNGSSYEDVFLLPLDINLNRR